ncbi:MAG: type II toxin-antitoxin system RelE/ParE family toxin [Steroidobacteraceae bacterium]|jgi:mRNA-degrading endonuclease RelE of RelBE toxin-antitoxin system
MIFIESEAFEQVRERYLDDDQYGLLQAALMANPDAGDLIPGAAGVRKVRWAVDGKGKRGGLRVIYYWITARGHILLLTLYRKSEVTDLSPKERKALGVLVKTLK